MKKYNPLAIGCYEGWERSEGNPVINERLVGRLGVEESADPSVVRVDGKYYMFATWLSQKKITFFTSDDGLVWSEPQIHLYPRPNLQWEQKIANPSVLYRDHCFHIWYSAQTYEKLPYIPGRSRIVHATSPDGSHWDREKPVLEPTHLWERESVMYPSVLWYEENRVYRLWYSAGEYDYPDAIGYAISHDGISWTKVSPELVLEQDAALRWEREKVGACHVVWHGGWFYMLYVAYEHLLKACFAWCGRGTASTGSATKTTPSSRTARCPRGIARLWTRPFAVRRRELENVVYRAAGLRLADRRDEACGRTPRLLVAIERNGWECRT